VELTQADQITLIQQGSFEVIFARYTSLFSDQGMFLPDMTTRIPRSGSHFSASIWHVHFYLNSLTYIDVDVVTSLCIYMSNLSVINSGVARISVNVSYKPFPW